MNAQQHTQYLALKEGYKTEPRWLQAQRVLAVFEAAMYTTCSKVMQGLHMYTFAHIKNKIGSLQTHLPAPCQPASPNQRGFGKIPSIYLYLNRFRKESVYTFLHITWQLYMRRCVHVLLGVSCFRQDTCRICAPAQCWRGFAPWQNAGKCV